MSGGPASGNGAFPPVPLDPVAVDPVTFIVNECMVILLAMRKMQRWNQSGVAAILGSGDLFGDEDLFSSAGHANVPHQLGASKSGSTNTSGANPLHLSFLQLRLILADTRDFADIDCLTLLQPFLLTIESLATLGHVTLLALGAIAKFLDYLIIGPRSKNLQSAVVQLILSLTRCRFEAADQSSDDAVLLKVMRLLEKLVTSGYSRLLPNAIMSEVIQTCLSLACNKRRSEVLRRAAEMTMLSLTIRCFRRLAEVELETDADDIPTNYDLQADFINRQAAQTPVRDLQYTAMLPNIEKVVPAEHENQAHVHEPAPVTVLLPTKPAPPLNPLQLPKEIRLPTQENSDNTQFGIVCISEYLGILISMISPDNQYQHMESTRVLALSLITTAIEVAGSDFPRHPGLMALVADPISKAVLQIITTSDSPALLQAALRLFFTMAIALSNHLQSQTELTFSLLFRSVLPPELANESSIKGNATSVNQRIALSKELIVESLSLLWTRSPRFFARLFVEFDCNFERTDMATSFVSSLCKLALPGSASSSADIVPPICIEGVLSLVSGVNDRVKQLTTEGLQVSKTSHPLILDKERKLFFIKCTEIFNESPKKGVIALCEKGFLKDLSDSKELAEFLFTKSARLNKKILGEYLAKPDNKALLLEFMQLFEFTGLRVDEALRLLLKAFRLPGESQQIERVVELFAESYVECQKNSPGESEDGEEPVRPDHDAVFVLSYSIIMLNVDLHSPKVKQLMDLEAYKKNLRGVYNGKDFPEWYLAKIYGSLKDREIIMPEEHHGTEKWFDDVWHNLISSEVQATSQGNLSIDEFDLVTLAQFDKLLFESTVDEITSTLIQVFNEATDDNIITKLMSSIAKCANVCIYYGLTSSVNKLIEQLTELTTLSGPSKLNAFPEEGVREEIPITQITIESKEESITISEVAVHFGRDFKAQLAMVVLFRFIKKPDCKVSESWRNVLKIILVLLENCLIKPNLFTEFQKKLSLQPLPDVKPKFVIKKLKALRDSSLLSTFSSFLKGYSDEPPEPTEKEIESSLSTIDCIKSVNVPGIFETVTNGTKAEITTFIDIVIENVPDFSQDKKRFYEIEVMFLFEILVCLSLIVNDTEVSDRIIKKLAATLKSDHISKKAYIRISTYLLLLARQFGSSHEELIRDIIGHLNAIDGEVLAKHGTSLVRPLISLLDDESHLKKLISDEQIWRLLRSFATNEEAAPELLDFASSIVRNSPEEISDEIHVPFLGLLDELSSLGAAGAQVEQSKEHASNPSTKNVESLIDSDQISKLVELSKSSITITGALGSAQPKLTYTLLQALAHQCFNPCREVRSHAVLVLQTTILGLKFTADFTVAGIFEFGLFPLLKELEKEEVFRTDLNGFADTHAMILSAMSKVFLQFRLDLAAEEVKTTWLGIVDHFVFINQLDAKFGKNEVYEPSAEVMKNMVLVLENEHGENEELWAQTWNSLDPIYPNMRNVSRDLVG